MNPIVAAQQHETYPQIVHRKNEQTVHDLWTKADTVADIPHRESDGDRSEPIPPKHARFYRIWASATEAKSAAA